MESSSYKGNGFEGIVHDEGSQDSVGRECLYMKSFQVQCEKQPDIQRSRQVKGNIQRAKNIELTSNDPVVHDTQVGTFCNAHSSKVLRQLM